jgi:hypothetical protein
LCSLKRKAEPAALTLAKALKANVALRMRTLANDASWLARYRAVMERLKSVGSSVQVGGSIEEAVGAREAARRPELVEAGPDATELCQSREDGREPRSNVRTLEIVEVIEAATSVRDTE